MLGEDFTGERQAVVKERGGFKALIGFVLLVMGVVGAVWIFHTVYSIFKDPMELTFFQQLVQSKLDVVINYGEGRVEVIIPKEFLIYGVPIALLVIATGAAGIIVKAGVCLLSSDVQKLGRKIDSLGDKLAKKIERK